MGPKSEAMDVESLQKVGVRRGRWLDCCLVLSVIVLFAALAALAAAGVLVVQDLQSKLQPPRNHPEFDMSKVAGGGPENIYKMQNFVYLEATSSELQNHTMPWAAVSYRAHKSVGSNYVFNQEQHSLQVKQAGSYFMYLELNITCKYRCEEGHLRVQVADKLTCEVQLPTLANSMAVNRKCWTVAQLSTGTDLLSQMTVPKLENWKLELRGSGFGMFLVGQ